MNKVVVPLRIFQHFKYSDFIKISGVGKKTANFLEDINECKTITSCKDIKLYIQYYNNQTNNKIRHNFINNNIIKMKNGNVYEFFYLK